MTLFNVTWRSGKFNGASLGAVLKNCEILTSISDAIPNRTFKSCKSMSDLDEESVTALKTKALIKFNTDDISNLWLTDKGEIMSLDEIKVKISL